MASSPVAMTTTDPYSSIGNHNTCYNSNNNSRIVVRSGGDDGWVVIVVVVVLTAAAAAATTTTTTGLVPMLNVVAVSCAAYFYEVFPDKGLLDGGTVISLRASITAELTPTSVLFYDNNQLISELVVQQSDVYEHVSFQCQSRKQQVLCHHRVISFYYTLVEQK